MQTILTITGMTCGNCRRHVAAALEQLEGVTGAAVDLGTRTATVHHSPTVPSAALVTAVTEAGYGAHVMVEQAR